MNQSLALMPTIETLPSNLHPEVEVGAKSGRLASKSVYTREPGNEYRRSHFIRKYHSDPVSTIALFGEVSKREAEQVWKEHKSVRKSLLSLEGKKKKRKFCIECVLLIILIIGLIIIYDWGVDQINKAQQDPRKNTFFDTLEHYGNGVPFPLLIFSDHGGKPDFRWIIEHHPNKKNTSHLCHIEIPGIDTGVRKCIMCSIERDVALCNTNTQDSMLCKNGEESPLPDNGNTYKNWTFCQDLNSTRDKCPSSRPFMSGKPDVHDGTDFGCGHSVSNKYVPRGVPFRACLDGRVPMDTESTCKSGIVELSLNGRYDHSTFETPGVYKICDSSCIYIIVPSFKYVDDQLWKLEVYVRHNGEQIEAGIEKPVLFASDHKCFNDNWSCFWNNYKNKYEGDKITYLHLGSKYKMRLSYVVTKRLDGNDEFDVQLEVNSIPGAMWSNISLVEFYPQRSIFVIQEYQHYRSRDIFNLMASYLTIWRALSIVISTIIFTNSLSDWCLEWIPRYSEPRFSNRFREKLWIMQQHDDMLVGMPADWTNRLDLIDMEQTKNVFRDIVNTFAPWTSSREGELESELVEIIHELKENDLAETPYTYAPKGDNDIQPTN